MKIKIWFSNVETAKAVLLALKPDNVKIPQGMKLSMNRRSTTISIQILHEGSLETLISTADEILSHCEVSSSVISKLHRHKHD